MKIFSGTAHPELGKSIAACLNKTLDEVRLEKNDSGEIEAQITESVRDCDVFLVQPTCNPTPNEYLMELLIMIDASKRSGAARVTAVIPVFGYGRQDTKAKHREPISAKVVVDILETAGVDRVLTVDLHASQIQGFAEYPIDNLHAQPLMENYLRDHLSAAQTSDLMIISADARGAKRAASFADRMSSGLAIFSGDAKSLVGNVSGKCCVLIGGLVDTAGTMTRAAAELMAHGANEVYAVALHGVLSAPAMQRIRDSQISAFIVTNTIPMSAKRANCEKLTVISVAPLLAEAIDRIHAGGSLSQLFENRDASFYNAVVVA